MNGYSKCSAHMCDGSGWRATPGVWFARPCSCSEGKQRQAEQQAAFARIAELTAAPRTMCPVCKDTGYFMQECGTATLPDWEEVRCRCNPEPTDDDAPDWEPMGTAYEDFHPFRANHYEGL